MGVGEGRGAGLRASQRTAMGAGKTGEAKEARRQAEVDAAAAAPPTGQKDAHRGKVPRLLREVDVVAGDGGLHRQRREVSVRAEVGVRPADDVLALPVRGAEDTVRARLPLRGQVGAAGMAREAGEHLSAEHEVHAEVDDAQPAMQRVEACTGAGAFGKDPHERRHAPVLHFAHGGDNFFRWRRRQVAGRARGEKAEDLRQALHKEKAAGSKSDAATRTRYYEGGRQATELGR